MAKTCFGLIDLGVAVISLCSFILDIGSDVAVCAQLLHGGLLLWGWMTFALILIPAFIMNAFSLAWHIHDKTITPLITMCHLTLLAPIQRYINVIRLGKKSRQSMKVVHTQKARRAQNDISILRLFEAFMESAPQLILQLFIMVNMERINWFTGLSACASFLSLSWSLTAYSDSLRRACKSSYHRRLTGLLLHWLWQLFMALSRISAFVFFAYAQQSWVFAVMGIHWLLAFIWICLQGTDFGNGLCEKWMFRGVCAFIYIFVFLNLNDGISRYRIAIFYVLMMIENSTMVILYFLIGREDYRVLAAISVFGAFVLGLFCMMIYYSCLHPTKPAMTSNILKLVRPKTRLCVASQTSEPSPTTRQRGIFSIESPHQISVMDGTTVNLSHQGDSNKAMTLKLQAGNSCKNKITVPLHCQQALKSDWEFGMGSSRSSSSSSLVSDQENVTNRNRPPSRTSENSHESENSNNCLIVSTSKNNLSKLPEISLEPNTDCKPDDKNSDGDHVFSDDMNVVDSAESLSLSRCSWGRSSDNTRQSLGIEEFVTLGFDCSSSIEQKVSESSSFSSHPRSLSPLNVANLWHDARSKLRQTIAATVAAATCNPSSDEGTPNKSRSFMSHTSSQNEISESLNYNLGFVDSKSSYHEQERDKIGSTGDGSLLTGKHREALSSLPDVFESIEHERLSDISYAASSKRSPIQYSVSSCLGNGESVKTKSSPHPEDSTLTASKLGEIIGTPISLVNCRSQSAKNLLYSSVKESSDSTPFRAEHNGSSRKKYNPDGSPFTDQELTSVMAKSLQSYTGASSSTDSTSKEREGLALTLEDLQYPSDYEDEEKYNQTSSIPMKLIDSVAQSRSTSSLFHDGEDSSPASSASKLQRISDLKKCDSEISPNAFKHFNISPHSLLLQASKIDKSLLTGDENNEKISHIVNSDALKILIDAYGQSSTKSPVLITPKSSKLSIHKKSESNTPKGRNHVEFSKKTPNCANENHFVDRDSRQYSGSDYTAMKNMSATSLKGKSELFDSIEWQKSKLKAKHNQRGTTEAYVGKSCTKKLNVLSNNHVLEVFNSPRSPAFIRSPEDNEAVNYVEGKYCPPLYNPCKDVRENSLLDNFSQAHYDSYKNKPLKKDITLKPTNSCFELPKDDSKTFPFQRSASLRKTTVGKNVSVNHEFENPATIAHDHVAYRAGFRDGSYGGIQNVPADHYSDTCNFDDARLVGSPLSFSQHQHSLGNQEGRGSRRSYSYLPHLDSASELELKLSAKQIENYYSQALRNDPGRNIKPERAASFSDLEVHSRRPLKSLQNSPHYIPVPERRLTRQSYQTMPENPEGLCRHGSLCNKNCSKRSSRRLPIDGTFMMQ